MAQLAIKGHPTRGSEVIALLEMLGGINERFNHDGLIEKFIYYICPEFNNNIHSAIIPTNQIVFSLEQFEEKFPYRVGNSARLSRSNIAVLIKAMKWENDEIVYKLSCDDSGWWSVNNLKPYRETMENNINYCQLGKITAVCFQDTNYEDKVELQLGNTYEIKEENGKFYAVKKKPQYPKTYEECCDILGRTLPIIDDVEGYKWELIKNFQRILVCRDAYWKIAGEQMGLGKPWEPDWTKDIEKYVIYPYQYLYSIDVENYRNTFLAFPTEEMRDAFYENFKDLIEQCKELL